MESIPRQKGLNHNELKLVINVRSHWSLPDGGPKTRKCSECFELGHIAKTCQGGLTAREKRTRLSSEEGSYDPITADTWSARGRGRGGATRRSSPTESSNASTSHIGGERPPTGRSRGRGRGASRLAEYFNA